MTILVVDDVFEMQKLLATMLEQLGYQVITGRNGEEGVQLLETIPNPPDLIISNYIMPKMNGLSFLQAIRGQPQWQSIPFVLFTAHSSDRLVVEAFDLGADDLLPKPFTMADLKSLLKRLGLS
jgi:two-component system chemotaxis response regulator CheY